MNLLPHLTRLARVSEHADDAQLLAAFVSRRDGDAFAALVRRHAGMVWNVCRRWLTNPVDAEDAFQATFLVLVRRAHSINRPEQLANWLYGVAIHAARKIRDRSVRRQRTEFQRNALDDIPARHAVEPELTYLLDEELQRLPEKYRLPVVLCHLRGMSRRQAAAMLGCPEGTLSARMARAMKLLRSRLIRRGLAPAAILGLTSAADAAPRLLIRATVAVALCSSLPAMPERVSQIANGVIQMLIIRKLTRASLTGLVLAGVLLSGGFLLTKAVSLPAFAADKPAPAKKTPPPSLTVKIVTDDAGALKQLVVSEDQDVFTMTTTQALARYLKRAKREKPALDVSVTPYGKIQQGVLNSVSQVCRESGFANCRIKSTADSGFELVQNDLNAFTNVYLDVGLSQLRLQPQLQLNGLQPNLTVQSPQSLNNPNLYLSNQGATLQGLKFLNQPDAYLSLTLADLAAYNQRSPLDGVWSVREEIGLNQTTKYDAGKSFAQWIIAGEYLINRKGDKYQVGKVHLEAKDNVNKIDYCPVAGQPECHHGTYTLKGDTLRVTFPGSVLSGGTDTVVLERVKPKAEAKKK